MPNIPKSKQPSIFKTYLLDEGSKLNVFKIYFKDMRAGTMKITVLVLLFLACAVSLLGQDPKPPVAEDDFASTFMSTPVTVNVLANDFAEDGHPVEIYAITDVSQGQATWDDSLIFYTPHSNNALAAQARVYYIIKDLTNGMYSEEGVLTVSLDRVKSRVFEPNGLNVRINALGNQFMKLDSFCYEAPNHHFEAPAGSGRHTIYNSALWVAGMDDNDNIHTACERYRKGTLPYLSARGWDYWVGPVVSEEHYTDEYLTEFNRLWYVTREEIRYHSHNYMQSNYILPSRIKNWPGNGFPELGSAEVLAPFKDVNENGYYDPENGDYPLIRGDEAIYFIFNDDYGEHTDSFGRKLGLEGHGLAYGFSCAEDSAFRNTLFVSYGVINRSDTAYHDVYLGNYTNLPIGAPDDFLGCDTVNNAYYAYNMDDFDDTISVYYPGYMEHPPAQAVLLLNQPMDHFMFFHFPWPINDTLYNLAPTTPERYYNYMKSIWNDSTHLTYGGNGHQGTVEVNHALTGDPLSNSGWTEENCGMDSLILTGIGSAGPFDFEPGDTLSLELAYVFARDYEGDHLSSVQLLKERMESIKWHYDNDSTPCATPWVGVGATYEETFSLDVFPNPAREFITVSGVGEELLEASILDFMGRTVWKGNARNGSKINTSCLEKGLYLIVCKQGHSILSRKFVKN